MFIEYLLMVDAHFWVLAFLVRTIFYMFYLDVINCNVWKKFWRCWNVLSFYHQTMKCFLKHLLNTKSVCHLVGMYYRTKRQSVRVFACICVRTQCGGYSVLGKRVFTFSLIAVSFDTTILLTDRVMGLEQDYILTLYQCGIRICPWHLNRCYLNTDMSFSFCCKEFAQLLLVVK